MATRVPYSYNSAEKRQFNIEDFSGGLNLVDSDATIRPNQLRTLKNFRLTAQGKVQKRAGQGTENDITVVNAPMTASWDGSSSQEIVNEMGFLDIVSDGFVCTHDYTADSYRYNITANPSNYGLGIVANTGVFRSKHRIHAIAGSSLTAKIKLTGTNPVAKLILNLDPYEISVSLSKTVISYKNASGTYTSIGVNPNSAVYNTLKVTLGESSIAIHMNDVLVSNVLLSNLASYDTLSDQLQFLATGVGIIDFASLSFILHKEPVQIRYVYPLNRRELAPSTPSGATQTVYVENKYSLVFYDYYPYNDSDSFMGYAYISHSENNWVLRDTTYINYMPNSYRPSSFDEVSSNQCRLMTYREDKDEPNEGVYYNYEFSAVNYNDIIYIATGQVLLQMKLREGSNTWDNPYLTLIDPYAPLSQEAVILGYNLLAKDPKLQLTNGTGSAAINAIIPQYQMPDSSYSVVTGGGLNIKTRIKAYYNKPSGNTTTKFKFAYGYKTALGVSVSYTQKQDHANDYYDFVPDRTGYYDFQITMYDSQTTPAFQPVVYYFSDFYVQNTYDYDKIPDVYEIQQKLHSCTKLLVHFDQLVLYGGSNTLFYSRPYNFAYFPHTHYVTINTPQDDTITSCIPFYNTLATFTEHTIWSIKGSVFGSEGFAISQINENVGALSGNTVRAIGNYLYFQSSEGIMILKTLWAGDLRLNVELIDAPIRVMDYLKHLSNRNTFGSFTSDSYKWYVPDIDNKKTYCWAYNYILRSWYYEEYPFIVICRPYYINGIESLIALNIKVDYTHEYKHLSVYGGEYEFDDGVTPVIAQLATANLDLETPYHEKKFKQLFIHHILDTSTSYELDVSIGLENDIFAPQETFEIVTLPDGTITANEITTPTAPDSDFNVVTLPDGTITAETFQVPSDPYNGKTIYVSKGSDFDAQFDTFFGTDDNPKKSISITKGKGHTIQITLTHKKSDSFGIAGLGVICKFKQKPKVR